MLIFRTRTIHFKALNLISISYRHFKQFLFILNPLLHTLFINLEYSSCFCSACICFVELNYFQFKVYTVAFLCFALWRYFRIIKRLLFSRFFIGVLLDYCIRLCLLALFYALFYLNSVIL